MTISDDIRAKIEAEFTAWEAVQYAGLSKEERQKRAAFFTPPLLSIRMAEKFDSVIDKDILDPAAGAGGLLVVMILCGADPSRIYGIELDPKIAAVCRARLGKLGVLRHHIHVGNALDNASYDFKDNSKSFSLKIEKTGKEVVVKISVIDSAANTVKNSILSISNSGKINLDNVKKLYKTISTLVEKELEANSKTNSIINSLNDKVFLKVGLQPI